MKLNNTMIIFGCAALLLVFISSNSSASNLNNATFDLSVFDSQFDPANVNRLNNLFIALLNATDPNTGQPLSTLQIQLMLSQALHETGLFTDVANLNLVDNYNNFAGINGNSYFSAGPNGVYAQYPTISAFVGDWLRVLSMGTNPVGAASTSDFVNRLKSNNYFTDTTANYLNNVNYYYNLLNQAVI